MREGSEAYPEGSRLDAATWKVETDPNDGYDLSAVGSLALDGYAGELLVRVRYRIDDERLDDGVIREERGFWSGDDEPDRGDVPLDTDVMTWDTDLSPESREEDFLRVCETALTLDPEALYDGYADGLGGD